MDKPDSSKPGIEGKRLSRIVKKIWDVMAAEGICDSFGSHEYSRCESIAVAFVKTIYEQCNYDPAGPPPHPAISS